MTNIGVKKNSNSVIKILPYRKTQIEVVPLTQPHIKILSSEHTETNKTYMKWCPLQSRTLKYYLQSTLKQTNLHAK